MLIMKVLKNFTINNYTDPILTHIEYLVLNPNHFINEKLKQFPNTYERAIGVFELSTKIGGEDSRKTGIYLRASLGELVSMEETLKLDSCNRTPLKLNQIDNTLLHILRQLRNFQFHIKHVKIRTNYKEEIWSSESDPNFSTGLFMAKLSAIEKLDMADLRNLRSMREYNNAEIEHMINWLDENQKDYSIQSLVLKGLRFYTNEIVSHYDL